jgi:TM2 domain-containing membrane protein YozV
MSSPEVIPTGEVPSLPPAPPAAPARAAAPALKMPWVGLLLSLVMPGLGQIYNGQVAKGVTFFVGFSGTIYLITEGHVLPFAIFLPFLIFANMIDAFRSAVLINERGTKAVAEDDAESPWWGIGLAAMGVLLLFNNLGWLQLAAVVRYWPILLIAAGLLFLRRSVPRKTGDGPSL